MECIPSKKHVCNICNKEYSSRQNLWKHSKKFHSNDSNPEDIQKNKIGHSEVIQKSSENPVKIYVCLKCNAKFKYKQGKWKHEKKCNINKINEQTEKLKEENELLKKEMIIMKEQLMILINKQCKIHPKTLNKINNTTINNDNKVINNTINIIALGNESLDTFFNKNKQIDFLKYRYQCLPQLIKEVHFNDKYPQFKNILITNTQTHIAYKYDKIEQKFIAIDKNELLEDIITERMGDIETFYEELETELDEKTKNIIEKLKEKIENDPSYKELKKNDIKLIIYNNTPKKYTKCIAQHGTSK